MPVHSQQDDGSYHSSVTWVELFLNLQTYLKAATGVAMETSEPCLPQEHLVGLEDVMA
jgi:hypothetical protein